MYRSITLLERLARRGAAPTAREDRVAVLRSIIGNMQRILNTRQGSAAAQMDLGLPSPHELMQAFPASVDDAQRAIRACILKFEPRLSNVVVAHLPSDDESHAITFTVSAQLAGDKRDPVSFSTSITPDGRIRLKA